MNPVTPATRQARPWWPWLRRALALLFFAAVAVLLVRQAGTIAWDEVGTGLRALPVPVLLTAAAFAAASHLLYACFDLLGRRYTGHHLPTATVMAVTFVSYAFNLSMGSLVGGVGFRYRLYARLGLDAARTTQIVSLSMFTNWIGYLLLAGAVLLLFPPALPATWQPDGDWLPVVGGLMVAVPLAYLAWCGLSRRRAWAWRGHAITLPPGRMALLQLGMSCTNWLLMAGVMHSLLQQVIPFPLVLGTLLAGAVAGVVTHVPAGLGVLEAVFMALLSAYAPAATLLAAVLAYRAIYYLAPLALAAVVYLLLEARARAVEAAPSASPAPFKSATASSTTPA